MFLIGHNFGNGTTPSARLGKTGCELSEWKSATAIKCKTVKSSGIGPSAVAATVFNAVNISITELTNQIIYDAPSLSAEAKTNMPSSGSVSVTIVGRGMGGSDGSVRVKTGLSGCGGSAWVSDSGVLCRGATGVNETGLRVEV